MSTALEPIPLPDLDNEGRARLSRLLSLASVVGASTVIELQSRFLALVEGERGTFAAGNPSVDLISDCLEHLRASVGGVA